MDKWEEDTTGIFHRKTSFKAFPPNALAMADRKPHTKVTHNWRHFESIYKAHLVDN